MMGLRRIEWWCLCLAGLCLLACSDDESKPTDPSGTPFPYQIPPGWTLTIDVSELSAPDSAGATAGTCYGHTGLLAYLENRILEPKLSLAAATVAACLQQPSEFDGDVTWIWKATGDQGGSAWSATLYAYVVSPDSVIWWEDISGTANELEDFYFIYGYSDGTARSGFWQIYHPEHPEQQTRLVESRWSRQTGSAETRSARFDIFASTADTAPRGPGDWASYELADSIETLVYHEFSQIENTGHFTASWDSRTGAGQWTQTWFQSGPTLTCCWGPKPERADRECP